jgi:hypothetical protein
VVGSSLPKSQSMKFTTNYKPLQCLLIPVAAILLFTNSHAQQAKEATTDLSKAAQKGMLTDTRVTEAGTLNFTYGMRVNKKDENLNFEDYTFDKDLNFKGMVSSKNEKEIKPNITVKLLAAYVGGSTSFTVLSQKLSLQKEEWEKKWNYNKQQYEWGKRLSKEGVKPKNDEGKYLGYAEYNVDNGVLVIASYQPEKKGAEDQFLALFIDMDLNIKETPVTTDGNYSLVYSGVLANKNVYAIMAPNKKMPDLKQYVYAEFTPEAALVKRTVFTAPSTNLMVMDQREINGSLYLVCASTNEKVAYNEVLTNYSRISNPAMGISSQDQKYIKVAFKEKMENFHFLKFTNSALDFATTVPIKTFKDKVATPPSQKKAHIYQGNRLYIDELAVLKNGDFLLAGQLLEKDIVKDVLVTKYLDIVGFHFDANGELKAQFAVEKMNDDTKSEIWTSDQNFHISEDGKTAYWEILEVKGFKGYDSFLDAYLGDKTYTYGYFPRVSKINLANSTLSDFEVMGSKGKFIMYKNHSDLTTLDGKTRYYIGHDEDYEKLWIGKYNFN